MLSQRCGKLRSLAICVNWCCYFVEDKGTSSTAWPAVSIQLKMGVFPHLEIVVTLPTKKYNRRHLQSVSRANNISFFLTLYLILA